MDVHDPGKQGLESHGKPLSVFCMHPALFIMMIMMTVRMRRRMMMTMMTLFTVQELS